MRRHGLQHGRRGSRGSRALATAVAGALVGTLVGVVSSCSPADDTTPAGATGDRTTSDRPTAGPARSAAAPEPRPTAVVDVPVHAATPPARPRVDPPVELHVADGDITMAVVPVGVAQDGTMELPAEADVAGWYRYGPAPGARAGNAVLAAHVDSAVTGVGPLVALRDVDEGSRLTVTTRDGRELAYSVTGVDQVPKTDAPLRSWFERDGPAQLVLITCGGAWDAEIRHYSDNVVLTAEPVGE